MTEPHVTIVVPVRNEAGNIGPLVDEIERALSGVYAFELIVVDDGSDDGSGEETAGLAATRPWLRHLRHDTSCGKSAAVKSAVSASRAPLIVTLDGDGQNNPAFIPAFLTRMAEAGENCGLVQGAAARP